MPLVDSSPKKRSCSAYATAMPMVPGSCARPKE
ncbi:Uncharacterised protein [Mycobacteroides abscessus subsp. abscessus]|nr:Uncharacterised protein [Mycobacteroides abscessus subsp. abscessus]